MKRTSEMRHAFSTNVYSMLEQQLTHKVTLLIADPSHHKSTTMPVPAKATLLLNQCFYANPSGLRMHYICVT